MLSFGIDCETLDIIILLAGFINRLILIVSCAFNLMLGWLSTRKSTVFLSLRYMQNWLLDMRETNFMFFGGVNLLIAMILSIESKTIACSFSGRVALRVVSANDFFPEAYFSD